MNEKFSSQLNYKLKPGALEEAMLELHKKDGKRRLQLSAILLVAIMLLVYVASLINRNQILQHNAQLCETTTKQTANNINALINISLKNLKATALICGEANRDEGISAEELQYLRSYTQFDQLLYIDNKAWAIDEEGNYYNLIDNIYYLDALEGNSGYGVSTMSPAASHTRAVFYTPVLDAKKQFAGVLCGYYNDTKIIDYVGEEHAARSTDFYIIDQHATILASSDTIAAKDNIYKHLLEKGEITPASMDELLDGVFNLHSVNMVRQTKDGEATACLVPIYGSPLTLLLTFPAKEIANIQHAYLKQILLWIGLLLGIFACYTFIMAKMSKRLNEQLLQSSNELLNIVNGTSKIFCSFMLVDLEADRCNLLTESKHIHGFQQNSTYQYFLDHVCTQYFRATNIGEDCSKILALENLLPSLMENKGTAYAEVYDHDDCYWGINIITLKEVDGKPSQLLFLDSDITAVKKAELANKQALKQANEALNKSNASLKELAARDALTGTHSRHYLNNVLLDNTGSHFKDGALYSIAILDVDHFKEINDTYGHRFGDKALVTISNTIYKCIRPNKGDYVIRYGGDEFIILYHKVDAHTLKHRLELLRNKLAIATFEDAPQLRLTVSVGAVVNNDTNANFKELFAQADKKLYLSKENGRNQVSL